MLNEPIRLEEIVFFIITVVSNIVVVIILISSILVLLTSLLLFTWCMHERVESMRTNQTNYCHCTVSSTFTTFNTAGLPSYRSSTSRVQMSEAL